MSVKTSAYGLAFLISILVASPACAEKPGAVPEAATVLRLFKGTDQAAAFQQFEKVVPLEKRQESLFSAWSASDGESEGVAVKSNILRYLSWNDNLKAVWQPQICLLAYGATKCPSADVRLLALDLLAKRNDDGVREVLWAMLGDEDDRGRLRAVEAVAEHADAATILGDYVRVRAKGADTLPSVLKAKQALSLLTVPKNAPVTLSADGWKTATKLVDLEKIPPPREFGDMYAGKILLEQLPAEQWSACLCEAWILSSQLCTEPEYNMFRGWVLWYLSPHNSLYKEIEPAWSTRLEGLVCAATRDRAVRYYATLAILKRGSRTLALSLAYDDDPSVAGWALNSLYANHRKEKAFVEQVYEAYLRQNVGKENQAVLQVRGSMRLLQGLKP